MTTDIQPAAMILGEVASPGLARGRALVYVGVEQTPVVRRLTSETEARKGLERFDAAISEVEKNLLELKRKVQQDIGRKEAEIFEAQILILRDPTLREGVSTRCLTEKTNVEAAVDEAIQELTSLFARLEDPYFRERGANLRDVGKRLLDVLTRRQSSGIPVLSEDSVIVTSELLPSIIAQLDSRKIRGLIMEKGGQTAHATILARALGIPTLIHVSSATQKIRTGDRLIIDGLGGRVLINPTSAVLREYDQLEADLQTRQTALNSLIELPAVTLDGVAVKLCANIGKSADAAAAAKLNADCVGLYRTEFVFRVQNHFPSEEEQYEIYRTTANRMKPREVVIRVLDIGSDKLLQYFPLPAEANPSLGCRGTRLLLVHPEILRAQLRAVLRVSATHPVSILFPMIGGVEDLLAVKAVVEDVKAGLTAERLPFDPRIPIGAMIETPSAAIMIDRLAQEADFFSIGTNDLIQYLLTADRTSSEVAAYYEPLHPAVLQVLSSLSTSAKATGKSISICGEMAGNPAYTQLLLGLGFRCLSVSPGMLLEVKNAIRSTDVGQAEDLAKRILRLGTIQEIKKCLRSEKSPVQ